MVENQHTRYGAIAKALPFTPGNIFFVLSPSDALASNFLNEFPADNYGRVRSFTSLKAAYNATTSNQNDVIILSGNSTHTLTEMLTVSKNRVHFYGADFFLGVHRPYGCSTKVALGVTAAATDIATIKNTGVRNSFHNIKFTNANTVAQGLYCFVEGGEYTYMENCEIYKSTDMDESGAAELVQNGDSAYYKNCVIGSNADVNVGAVIRANVLLTGGLAGAGKVSRDTTFEGCQLWKKASNVANRFVYAAADADVERLLIFKDCLFYNDNNAAASPAQCIAAGANITIGHIVCVNPQSVNNTKVSTTTGVMVIGAAPNNGTGIAVNAA
jgi:hypothetical protein